ncbi:ribonuclease P protein subunit p20-like [Mizuhopecten yessoensis]|uniref:Ribonuclease P protein subunit p20 n=1 Tax=Mizuhopecten yessoensis TaxID=6573 RepID=A0A210QBC8_MIZYE|nr:ribonuclease P protein subunit p20-like [Mizuhopecten yessoensis]OWF46032.1 Ribonuclease P protein subunit p20 [Mizuhopecten yessoensis]
MQSVEDRGKTHPRSKSAELKDLIDQEEFTLRKRLPRKLPKRKNDVYVSRKTDFKSQLERCKKILDLENEVFIHGLGAAITRASNLALTLELTGRGSLSTAVHTSTVELVDDLEPDKEDNEPDTFSRNNSAIHIKVYKVQSALLVTSGEDSSHR